MDQSLGSRLKHAWNVFMNRDPTGMSYQTFGGGFSSRPDRVRLSRGNERSVVTSVYNRIAMDVAAIGVRHVRQDQNGRFLYEMESSLNHCLTVEANLDQTSRAFYQDMVMSVLDEGVVAVVPTVYTSSLREGNFYSISSLRTGKITEWFPNAVRVQLYNEQTSRKEEIIRPKNMVAIIENPLYAIINEPNSTMQRLIRKLNLLDLVDEQSSSGKLDLIIQLPYIIKTDARRDQAEKRRRDIEEQLSGSKYGIAYTDGTERITQLNRSVGNNLMSQIEYLTSMLYSQLGISQSVLDGTANEETMLNYYDRTIEPMLSAFVDEFKRKFLTQTARSQLQTISYFRDPFKLVPVNQLAEIADKFTRNEIVTSNEIRQIIGMKPSDDPKADELRNSNLKVSEAGDTQAALPQETGKDDDGLVEDLKEETQNGR